MRLATTAIVLEFCAPSNYGTTLRSYESWLNPTNKPPLFTKEEVKELNYTPVHRVLQERLMKEKVIRCVDDGIKG
jgi:hypothetical protein